MHAPLHRATRAGPTVLFPEGARLGQGLAQLVHGDGALLRGLGLHAPGLLASDEGLPVQGRNAQELGPFLDDVVLVLPLDAFDLLLVKPSEDVQVRDSIVPASVFSALTEPRS